MLEDEKRKDQLLALTVLLVIINGNGDDDLTEATQLVKCTVKDIIVIILKLLYKCF